MPAADHDDSDKSKTKTAMRLPQVDLVLRQAVLEDLVSVIDRTYLTVLVREELARLREGLRSAGGESPEAEAIAAKVAVSARALLSGGLERVINATGVVLNTNLGRAPLPESVLSAMKEIGSGYSSLEIDLESGKRGERTRRTSRLLGVLTGSEMAIVVNNNASSVMLAVAALAHGKEVIVSRGELIEIGGSFRLPDVIAGAGGTLKEVGTTNKTRLSDYRNALSDRTGMILKCHRSNFEITGFTEEVGLEELVSLSRESAVPVVEDLGSGAFFDMSRFGLQREPTVRDSIEAGAGLVLFSGDKLLGGPQAGIAAGSMALVERLRKNPMYRALRADKLVIAILENVLSLYLSPHPEKEVAVLALAAIPLQDLEKRAREFASSLDGGIREFLDLEVVPTRSAFGGGSTPGQSLPSYALSLGTKDKSVSASALSTALRRAETPVITTVNADRVLIDFRTILEADIDSLRSSLKTTAEDLFIKRI